MAMGCMRPGVTRCINPRWRCQRSAIIRSLPKHRFQFFGRGGRLLDLTGVQVGVERLQRFGQVEIELVQVHLPFVDPAAHPNVNGSQVYANEIISLLKTLPGRF